MAKCIKYFCIKAVVWSGLTPSTIFNGTIPPRILFWKLCHLVLVLLRCLAWCLLPCFWTIQMMHNPATHRACPMIANQVSPETCFYNLPQMSMFFPGCSLYSSRYLTIGILKHKILRISRKPNNSMLFHQVLRFLSWRKYRFCQLQQYVLCVEMHLWNMLTIPRLGSIKTCSVKLGYAMTWFRNCLAALSFVMVATSSSAATTRLVSEIKTLGEARWKFESPLRTCKCAFDQYKWCAQTYNTSQTHSAYVQVYSLRWPTITIAWRVPTQMKIKPPQEENQQACEEGGNCQKSHGHAERSRFPIPLFNESLVKFWANQTITISTEEGINWKYCNTANQYSGNIDDEILWAPWIYKIPSGELK